MLDLAAQPSREVLDPADRSAGTSGSLELEAHWISGTFHEADPGGTPRYEQRPDGPGDLSVGVDEPGVGQDLARQRLRGGMLEFAQCLDHGSGLLRGERRPHPATSLLSPVYAASYAARSMRTPRWTSDLTVLIGRPRASDSSR